MFLLISIKIVFFPNFYFACNKDTYNSELITASSPVDTVNVDSRMNSTTAAVAEAGQS